MEENTQNSQKTVVSFIVGLLIGGLLVWVFTSAPSDVKNANDAKKDDSASSTVVTTTDTSKNDTTATNTKKTETPSANIGAGSIAVDVQKAGTKVALGSITYPGTDGWIAVHAMSGDSIGSVLGAARYSTKEGLLPKVVELLPTSPTVKGKSYAVVFHNSDGNRAYSTKTDTTVMGADGKFLGTLFTAN